MRVPQYHHVRTWLRFFSGVVIGAVISWFVFLFMYGVMQEKQIQKINEQQKLIKNLSDKNDIWEEDFERLNEETEKKLKIQDVQISISNGRTFHMDHLSIAEAEDAIRADLASLITKDVETIYKGRSLLKKAIENKILDINKRRYRLDVAEIFFYTNMKIEVRLVRL
ncbi:sporulation membrane protein YtrI [Bacillus sp. V5-8f]|uniref:sporulation membrane protein YtrI n=1 Tax=Bacillus sp. V5-8f TaxID=2053044 RepID=UPI000C77DAC8|nr:sporulation membrane protein YtrI [Bacillus sp. V5-8f]PLT32297.1 sporulation protein [Bacillus sp. V5-8f]